MRCVVVVLAVSVLWGGGLACAADEQPAAASQSSGESWRYRRHNGTWWYWLPSKQWAYWSGDKWVGYNRETYTPPATPPASETAAQPARQPARSYSPSGRQQSGTWGPVRHDRFGNPQYPYSMRKKGIKQIGVMPAPAGVRAWPGWGGAR